MPKFEVAPHPFSKDHLIFKVYSRGRCYACASASVESKPTVQTVEYHWKHNRQDFLPYDQSQGRYTS